MRGTISPAEMSKHVQLVFTDRSTPTAGRASG
jgi:hypothetical protein